MKKTIYIFVVLLITSLFTISVIAEEKINLLKNQIISLETQKAKLELEKQTLVNHSEELSYRIEELKSQSDKGIGIIGRYKLSQNLKKAQSLSEKIELLDRNINDLNNQISDKKLQLEREYENQINILIQRADIVNNIDEKRLILNKIKEYQSARDQLRNPAKQEKDRIDITSIEIKEYDSPKDIREKADLISDLAKKTDARISAIDLRIISLKNELKTRQKLNEFANEISFFGERVARDEIVSKSTSQTTVTDDKKVKEVTESNTNTDENILTTDTVTRSLPTEPKTTEKVQNPTTSTGTTTPTLPSTKKVMKTNGVSAGVAEISPSSIENELKALEKQKQDLKKTSESLHEKAKSFRQKADELEKSGNKTGETRGTKAKKQDQKDKTQSDDKSQRKR
ncbi:MAG: hypothetical protein ACPL7B_02525 [Candidatus Poribacteria bacterium]